MAVEYTYKRGKRYRKEHGEWVEDIDTPAESEAADARIREMVAAGKFPVLNTATSWLAGRSNDQFYDHCAPDMRDFYLNKAKAAGVNPRGKFYVTGLATEVGDPKAWVESPCEVKSRCDKEGWTLTQGTSLKESGV